ncbi:DUF5063 domain-containing protein [Actinocorallia sp. A-T 12471]|uniref:DUF5063 domain-containing protein n=1 Tax=Actinocorallia sp. A-T 12471 TaxID=3089813 RepID=UPI0029CB96F8|nr:DUF5063 domain-containing protein [Actinocorallia sp. A-T 12471]MDX6742645.1 DUF5063 domain-containing protein [Actinocorallia sp. A-T 12471]
MSSANTSKDWDDLAERVVLHVENYLAGLERCARGEAGSQTVSVLLLEVAQVMLAGAQLGASPDVVLPDNWEPEMGPDPDLDAIRQGLAERLPSVDDYAEVFDPYKDPELTSYRLSDDLVDVAADLAHGLRHYKAGRTLEALWWWQFSYLNHWGNHGGAALRALHAVVSGVRLNVAEERLEPEAEPAAKPGAEPDTALVTT